MFSWSALTYTAKVKLVFSIFSNVRVYVFAFLLQASKLNAPSYGSFQAQLYPVQNCRSVVILNVTVVAVNIFILILLQSRGRDSSVGVASTLRAGRPGFDSLLYTTVSRSTLGPTQPPIQWVPGALSPG
jgi:hypothetical protein